MVQNEDKYVILTPAGVLYSFSAEKPNEQQASLQAMLPAEILLSAKQWAERYSDLWLQDFIQEGWVELIDNQITSPHVQLDSFLPYVAASLSGSRRAAIASDEGFCLARIGFSQAEADTLCVAAADFYGFMTRQRQRGWGVDGQAISFFNNIDMLMPKTSFAFLWVNGTGYWLVLEDEPLLNNRAFVEMIWGIKATGERFSERAEASLSTDEPIPAKES